MGSDPQRLSEQLQPICRLQLMDDIQNHYIIESPVLKTMHIRCVLKD
jgi:hypothetical protein